MLRLDLMEGEQKEDLRWKDRQPILKDLADCLKAQKVTSCQG